MARQSEITKWDEVALGELCQEVIGGGTPKTSDKSFWEGDIPWITSKWLGKSIYLDTGEKMISESAVANSATRIVPKDSLIFATRVGVGKVGINRIPLAINQDLAGVVVTKEADPLFLAYQLQTSEIQQYIHSLKRGATIQGITREDLKRIVVKKPPIEEQKAIAGTLLIVQKAVAQQEKLIEKLGELKRSMMQRLFARGTKDENTKMTDIGELPESWGVVKLGAHIEKTKTINPTKKPSEEFFYIDVSAVSRNVFRVVSAQRIIGKDAPSRARKHILSGDILFATVRPTLQRIAIVPDEYNDQVASTGYCILRPSADLDTDFLFHYLCGDTVLKYVSSRQSGASYPAIRDSALFEMSIPFPSIQEQKTIGEALSAIVIKREVAEKRMAAYQDLFKTLLHELMSGERRIHIS